MQRVGGYNISRPLDDASALARPSLQEDGQIFRRRSGRLRRRRRRLLRRRMGLALGAEGDSGG